MQVDEKMTPCTLMEAPWRELGPCFLDPFADVHPGNGVSAMTDAAPSADGQSPDMPRFRKRSSILKKVASERFSPDCEGAHARAASFIALDAITGPGGDEHIGDKIRGVEIDYHDISEVHRYDEKHFERKKWGHKFVIFKDGERAPHCRTQYCTQCIV